MRLLYLDWPHLRFRLVAEALQRAAPAEPLPELVVVGGQPWEQGTVVDCSPPAARLGVRRGQPLGTAHKLLPEAHFVADDASAAAARFAAVLDALAAFTPSLEVEPNPADTGFGRCLLGIEGLHLLWGDELKLAGRLLATVEPLLPGPLRLGIANSRFGAQVAAVVGAANGRRPEVVEAGAAAVEAAYLAPLPIRLLPADELTRERLRMFGLTSIGQLAALSRSAVVARFGAEGGLLHDLARGLDDRPLRPRQPIEQLRAEVELEPPVDEVEPLRFVLRHLCGALCGQLAARGAGAGRANLLLELDAGQAIHLEQALPEPTAAPELLERLLLARLAGNPPPAAVTRLALELDAASAAVGRQLGLFAPQLARAGQLDWQLAGLALRYGPQRVLQARIVDAEAIVPEQRVEWRPASASPLSAT
jgi:protein ImuB